MRFENPAVNAFVAEMGSEFLLGQVLICRTAGGFEMRHVEDRDRAADKLREVKLDAVRQLAQFTAAGEFRPLRSAPNLQSGWRLAVRDEADLEFAINQLYPGAVADWFASRDADPPVTSYREFTSRQTGMYRITTMLADAQAAQMIRACCHEQFCLKRRLWSVAGLESDAAANKSVIPCLEPCAILLEFARKAVRVQQAEKTSLAFSHEEIETLQQALEMALQHPSETREADFNDPANRRRIRLLLEKLRGSSKRVDGQK